MLADGLVHLLDLDFSALCGCPYGLITGSVARCTCASCLSLWEQSKHEPIGRPGVTGDSDETGH